VKIIDAQIHNPLPFGDLGRASDNELGVIVSAEMALSAMRAVGVDAAVFAHPPPVTLEELETDPIPAVSAPALYPGRFGGVVTPDPTRVANIDEMLSQLRTRFGLLAIRMTPSWPAPGPNGIPRLRDGGFDDWFGAAEKYQVPICLFIAGHLGVAHRIAAAFPDLTLIIDHLGLYPPPRVPVDGNSFDALPELVSLAQHPNVAVKFTGVTALSSERYPFADLWPRVLPVIEAFTPARLMWGSDYTRVATLHNYSEAVNFLRYTREVSESDKEAMFSTTIRRLLRWPDATQTS
jgi:L-fuconolactonase